MDLVTARRMCAPRESIFELAAAAEDWPHILPHYRSVKVVATDRDRRMLEFSARRAVGLGLQWPLWWRAVQTIDPAAPVVRYHHVDGLTRGMRVEWHFKADADDSACVMVEIQHVFEPRWPVPGWLIRKIVGDYFVNAVATRTLACIATLAESRAGT